MFKIGLQKETLFFCRSFRMWGVIIAAFGFALLDPLLMKAMDSLSGALEEVDPSLAGLYVTGNMSAAGITSAMSDLSSTLLLVMMLVTMYAAGGELKKRSMIIPQNAGLTPQLYILPKFMFYPVFGALLTYIGMLCSYLITLGLYSEVDVTMGQVALGAVPAAVFQLFMTALYFTLGLCTARAGLSVVIVYGGNVLLSALFYSLGADKFHPFALTSQAQEIIMGADADFVNLLGSIAVTVLLIALCYALTLFVISAKRIDNRGVEEINL